MGYSIFAIPHWLFPVGYSLLAICLSLAERKSRNSTMGATISMGSGQMTLPLSALWRIPGQRNKKGPSTQRCNCIRCPSLRNDWVTMITLVDTCICVLCFIAACPNRKSQGLGT